MAQPSYTPVLMTRFNLATPGKEASFRNSPGWLDTRFDLFERYCLPTVAAQTCQDFHWVVYFDIDTPRPFVDRIDACRRVRPFHAFYTPLFASDGWRRSLTDLKLMDNPYVLTTRLDNDDGLASEFMARLHEQVDAAEAQNPTAFNFTRGFILTEGRLYQTQHPSNAFLSWLEPCNGQTRTVMDVQHMQASAYGPIRQIGGDGAWLQVVHDCNVSNKVRGQRVSPGVAQGLFPDVVTKELRPAGKGEMLVDHYLAKPGRDLRDVAIRALRSIRS